MWIQDEKMFGITIWGNVIQNHMKYYLIPIKMSTILKIQKITIVGKKEKLTMLCIVTWIVRWTNLHVEIPHNLKARVPL